MLRRLCVQRLVWPLFLCLFLLVSTFVYGGTGIGFQPVSPQELSMTSEPAAPGAAAIILYRQVDRNDNRGERHQDVYVRIKILTDAGRRYADVEIPFVKELFSVADLHARSIAPDGTITNYEGKIFEKTIYKARGLRYLAKVFTVPNVQKGGIVEYYCRFNLNEEALFSSEWILSEELFTKEAKFSLKSYKPSYAKITVHWSWRGLPDGTSPPVQGSDGIIRLEARNIPAFQTEDYMPPERELKARVDFIYSWQPPETDKIKFWDNVGKERFEDLNEFLGKPGALRSVVAQIVSPTDDPETKLRKLYARVQQLRNTSYEARKTEQEEKRENSKAPKNVEDIWKTRLWKRHRTDVAISRVGSRGRI